MFLAILFNHLLEGLGVLYFGTIVWKIARGYPVSRWFV